MKNNQAHEISLDCEMSRNETPVDIMSIAELKSSGFEGEVYDSQTYRMLYATDASIYRELPVAVVFPKHAADIQLLVKFVSDRNLSIIPRGAGTSLAGQCVGDGLVMDVSRHMKGVLSLDLDTGHAVVEPGLVRDELNRQLSSSTWWFGPNTSTSNRATIGGMVGNNSSGTTSVAYGVTRDKIVEIEAVLSDGTIHTFSIHDEYKEQDKEDGIPFQIGKLHDSIKGDKFLISEIENNYPHPSIHRRNTGYALDYLISENQSGQADWTKVICGSEGTLCLVTKVKVKLDKRPPAFGAVVVSHFNSLDASLQFVPNALDREGVYALELMDDTILNCARQSASQRDNLFFIEGDPKAVLMTELRTNTSKKLELAISALVSDGQKAEGAYSHRRVDSADIHRVWALRSAGLGVLSNIAGDDVALACIEDTAVHPDKLAEYIRAFASIMKNHDQKAIYYAHAGAGELHLRPVLNLKTTQGKKDFRSICEQSARLVKKYNGSLSGEHGDGRVRAPFIREFYGDKIYQSLIELKRTFDPKNIFNPGKIVEAKDLLADIRFNSSVEAADESGVYNYAPDRTLFHHAERCNGSGDCRKSHDLSPGMCPTYQATGEEIYTTRARANLVREALSVNGEKYPLADDSLKESMSSCLACKACKTECPSGVDVALMKSEYLYQRRRRGKKSLRDFILAHPGLLYRMNKYLPFSAKYINSGGMKWLMAGLGFAAKRTFPMPARRSLMSLLRNHEPDSSLTRKKRICLAIDEFVNYFDISSGLACLQLLSRFGYEIELLAYDSGRALISKGFLAKAEKLALKNVKLFDGVLKRCDVILGVEPSAILSVRDEYGKFNSTRALSIYSGVNSKVFLVEEFLLAEIESDQLNFDEFEFENKVHVLQHVHCHQRALSDKDIVSKLLNAIPGWLCEQINTGCCGMAGGFGYEAEHFELSQAVANMGLFPAIKQRPEHYIVASGMSCRHQIRDGVQRKARHPAELMMKLMLSEERRLP